MDSLQIHRFLSRFNRAYLSRVSLIVFPILIVLVIVFNIPSVQHSTQIWDEKVRQYAWYLNTNDSLDSDLRISIHDLYTSETFNASTDLYKQRYASYKLAESLNLYCKLGVQNLAFDFFLEEETWVGKHLLADEKDTQELLKSLSCFEAVWVPIRSLDRNWSLPISPIAQLDNVRFAHVNTHESVLYSVNEISSTTRGQLSVPYMAEALAARGEVDSELLPILPSNSLSSFSRMRFEDLEVFLPLANVMPAQSLQEFYVRYFSYADNDVALPDTVLIGFTHDAQDQHDVAYNKGGPIKLPHIVTTPSGQVNNNSADSNVIFYGTEPTVAFTPGVYILASTAMALASDSGYVYLNGLDVFFLVALILFLFLLTYLTTGLNSSYKIAATFVCSAFAYILVSYLCLSNLSLLLPIGLPLSSLFILWLVVDFKYGSGLLSQLGELLRSNQSTDISEPGQLSKPCVVVMAESIRDSHVDSYKHLVSSIDILTYWVQLLALINLAEYFEKHSSERKKIDKGVWKKWRRPTLGNYLHIFRDICKQYSNISDAVGSSRFPQLYHLTRQKGDSSIESLLFRIIDIRNEWKHFASTGYTEAQIQDSLDEVYDIEQGLNRALSFLDSFAYIKPKKFKSENNGTYYWDCLVYSGASTYIDEFATSDKLELDRLYLFDTRKWGSFNNTLCLEPWVFAGECRHHHREELFFFSGLENDGASRRYSKDIKYAGLTESCCPDGEPQIGDELFKLLAR
ncbi:hypothetical protein A3766_05975 [Oleiphilus sp. HI0132]|uniref:hypothetical protein n=1 Tax=Oleiphilus sp. HI0132 TaxID=1822270 RepID=UPI0007C3EBCB|nr:hypothetical protein [Oleiphilus sp. HI0132]KZZ73334.1 hypothetical protein A3766_05975 [Oleiphilus sp. HI0132]